MKQTIDQILNFYKNNRLVYKNLVQEANNISGIMPFVGDALSKFAFGSRDDFIDEVISETAKNDTERQQKIMKSKSVDFLETLDSLIQEFGKTVIDKQLSDFYLDAKIDNKYLVNQPISLIPYVNEGNCVTASMDHVINHSYILAHIPPDITSPYDHRKINTRIQGHIGAVRDNIVLKLHGDLLTDSKYRVLTKEDYNNQYCEGTEFYSALSKWIQNYILLYIGVDIHKDKYLFELIKQLKSEGSYHYAIIGCENDEKCKKQVFEFLDEINILPILYDEEKPESLEMLIHKLLIDTNNVGAFTNGELDYKYSQHDLVGRDEEIESLMNFLNCDQVQDRLSTCDFKWWVICGEGVTGKSRLAFDFARLYANDWEWYMLEPEEIQEFMNEQIQIQKARRKNRKVFIIFDNFDWYKGDIASIFEYEKKISMYTSKLRILFIIYNYEKSIIYKKMFSKEHEELWKKMVSTIQDKPLELRQLSKKEILILCHEYIYYRATQLDIANEKLEILFNQIDEELQVFISELYDKGEINILYLSQLKVISLIKNKMGVSYQNDKDIADEAVKYTISSGNKNVIFSDFDYEKWFEHKKERVKNAQEIKEYFKNEEITEKGQHLDSYEDTYLSKKMAKLDIHIKP